MDKSRAIAWGLFIIVTLCTIMLGRGCMGEPDTSGLKKPAQKTDVPEMSIVIETGAPVTEPPVYDIFGRPVQSTASPFPAESETTTSATVPPETDVFGNIVTSEPLTDVSGSEVTETSDAENETSTAEADIYDMVLTAITAPEYETTTETTVTLSPIEQYEKDLKNPDSIGGFNHHQYDEEGNPVPTLPPDFAIIIN